MKKPSKRTGVPRRLAAVTLAVTVLWVVFATAGSETLRGALDALSQRSSLAVALLRAQLGDSRPESDWLTTATAMVISQSPLLLSSREAILELHSRSDGDDQAQEPPDTNQPIRETPMEPEEAPAGAETGTDLTFADNGVTPQTLVPTGTAGYIVTGRTYINNYSDNDFDASLFDGTFAARLSEAEPQVLIVHTHGSEAYTMPPGEEYEASGESRTTDTAYNVVRVGDEIAGVLGEYGISVVHDRTLHDYPEYNGAYDRSLASIESYLEKYPSISIVLDIHRDAIYDGEGNPYKVVSQVAEGRAAQMTFVIGTDGSGLPNDNWPENLKLAAAVQDTLLTDYPTLMRPITVRNSRYNQHCTTGSLLVEVGAAGNSLDEALLSARLLAAGLAETLQGAPAAKKPPTEFVPSGETVEKVASHFFESGCTKFSPRFLAKLSAKIS